MKHPWTAALLVLEVACWTNYMTMMLSLVWDSRRIRSVDDVALARVFLLVRRCVYFWAVVYLDEVHLLWDLKDHFQTVDVYGLASIDQRS